MPDYDERIRSRAYRIWEDEGRPEGREREHWQRAIADLEGEDDVRGPGAEGASSADARPAQPQGQGRAEGIEPGGGPQGPTPGTPRGRKRR